MYAKKDLVVFHNGSAYDYHFISKKLAKEFEGQLECLGENAERNILLFQYQLKKNLIMIKQLHTNQSVLMALDLCQPDNLSEIYSKTLWR